MATTETRKIYRIELPGIDSGIEKVKRLNQEIAFTKAVKQEAQKVLLANPADTANIERQSKIIAESDIALKKLNAEKRLAVREADQRIKQAEREAQKQQDLANAQKFVAGSVNEAAASYKALLGLTRNAGHGTLINWQGETIGIEDAKTKLNGYKKVVDDFNRSLSPDGTLVGEYKTGIINAFRELGLGELIEKQKQDIEKKLNSLIARNKQLAREYQVAGKQGAEAFQKIEKELQDNIRLQERLEAQLKEMRNTVTSVGSQISKSIGSGFKNLITTGLGAAGITVGLAGTVSLISDSVKEFEQADLAVRNLSNDIELLGDQDALPILNKQANELADRFKFLDNDDITAAQDKLVTYAKLSSEEINKLIPVIINYAAKTGVDIPTAAEKMIGGLEGQGRALKQFGIEVKDTNGVAKNLDIILNELGKKVEGAADTFGQSAQGKIKAWRQSLNNAKEDLGGMITRMVAGKKSAEEIFDEAKKETDDYERSLKPLLTRYDELKSKTTLNKDEQTELRTIIQRVAELVPSAVTAFNEYGEALDINRVKAENFLKVNKDILAEKEFKAVEAQTKNIQKNLESIANLQQQLNKGTKKIGTAGGGVVDVVMTEDQRREVLANLREVQINAVQTADKLKDKFGKELPASMQQSIDAIRQLLTISQTPDVDTETEKKIKAERDAELEKKKKEDADKKSEEEKRKRESAAREAESRRKEEQQRKLRESDNKFIQDQIALENKKREGLVKEESIYHLASFGIQQDGNKRKREDEEIYQTALFNIARDNNDRKLKIIKGINAEERGQRLQLQLEMINDEKEFNNKIFEIRKTELERQQNAAIDEARNSANKTINNPLAAPTEKARAQFYLNAALLDIQEEFDKKMKDLEDKFKKESIDGERARGKAIEDLRKETNDALLRMSEENFKEQLADINEGEVEEIKNLATKLRADLQQILKSNKTPEQKGKEITKTKDTSSLEALDIEIKADEKRLEVYKEMLKKKQIFQIDYDRFLESLINKQIKREEQAADQSVDIQERKQEIIAEIQKGVEELVDSFIESVFDRQEQRLEKESEEQFKRLDNERELVLAQAQSQADKDAINKEYDQKRRELEKQQFEKRKEIQIKEIKVDAAMGAVKAIAQNPPPSPVGLLAAAFVLAQAALQIGTIKREQFEKGGDVPRRGGEFGGKPHSQGGTPFAYAGSQFEAEVGELAIIRTKGAPAGRRFTISGTHKQIASRLNSIGGGINFAPGARYHRLEYGGSLGDNLRAPENPAAFLSRGSGDTAALSEKMSVALDMIAQTAGMIEATNGRIDRLEVVQVTKSVDTALKKQVRNDDISTI